MTPRLNRALVLERAEHQPDGAGGFDLIWHMLGTLWGEIRPGTGRDVAGEEVRLASLPCRITLRAAPQGAPSRPAAGQRLRDGARHFMILAVTEADTAGHYLTCFCREEVPQ